MPATLPWPKMPKQPAKSFCRSPSRSLHWLARKRTTAWATVRRTVVAAWVSLVIEHLQGEVGGRRLVGPGVADPAVGGVVADEPGPLGTRAGHDVEVVEVVAGRGHRRAVPAVRHEDDVAGAHLGEHVDRPLVGAVDPLVADRARARGLRRAGRRCDLEVVDLLELGLDARPLLVVLVRRVGAPVAGRGDDLAGDDRVGVEHAGDAEVADLAATRRRPRAARRARLRRPRDGTAACAVASRGRRRRRPWRDRPRRSP